MTPEDDTVNVLPHPRTSICMQLPTQDGGELVAYLIDMTYPPIQIQAPVGQQSFRAVIAAACAVRHTELVEFTLRVDTLEGYWIAIATLPLADLIPFRKLIGRRADVTAVLGRSESPLVHSQGDARGLRSYARWIGVDDPVVKLVEPEGDLAIPVMTRGMVGSEFHLEVDHIMLAIRGIIHLGQLAAQVAS